MKSLTAEANKHYKAAAGGQLAFAPGEIYKEVKIGIINMDNSFEGDKTFQVIFSSSQRSVTMKGPQQVNVTIMYTKGKGKFLHIYLFFFGVCVCVCVFFFQTWLLKNVSLSPSDC